MSRASRDTYFSGRNRSLLSLQNNQENFQQRHNKHPDDILYILCISTNVFSVPSHSWSQSQTLSKSCLLPKFSLLLYNSLYYSVLKNKGITLATAMGKMHLASAVQCLWSSIELRVGRAVTPTCIALTAGCATSCPERSLENKQLAAACSSPQPQDSHKVLLQWECVFGSFLPGCSFSLLV